MNGDWSKILQSITAPVILFGLILLVLGSVAITTLIADLGVWFKVAILGFIWCTVVGVLVGVFVLTWFKPKNLIYTEAGHTEEARLELLGRKGAQTNKGEIDATETVKRTSGGVVFPPTITQGPARPPSKEANPE